MDLIINDESITNDRGWRLSNRGCDLARYTANPIVLYQHDTERIVGKASNIRIDGSKLIASVEFDTEDPLAKEVQRKAEKGFLRGVSPGFFISEMTYHEDYDSVTAWELLEVSIVSIPSNRGAVKLYSREGVPLDQEEEVKYLEQLKATDYSEFIKGHKVHVPNAGTPATISKNPSSFPVSVGERQDADVDFELDTFVIQPIRVGRTEELETSYNKRESVCSEARQALKEAVSKDTIKKWCLSCTKVRKKNDGESVKKWFVAAAEQFATDNVLATERYVMLTPASYYALLDSMTENEALAFSKSADVAKGVLGNLLGFDVVQHYLLPDGVDMLAWQKNSVGVAKGEPELFVDEGSATMYGDVISGQERAGGTVVRKDAKGVYLVNATGTAYTE